ncbi:MAG: hypothetical protein WBN88_20370 [Anderseniella sp.]
MMDPLYHTKAQKEYVGPNDLRLFADFLPHIGEFVLLFGRMERQVTWAIESFTGATRWDGNELEGMVQNFSSRIKFLDICARPKTREGENKRIREKLISRVRAINSFRNKLLHNSATGTATDKAGISIQLKVLDKDSGKERNLRVSLEDLRGNVLEAQELIRDLRAWVHTHCPDAEGRVP